MHARTSTRTHAVTALLLHVSTGALSRSLTQQLPLLPVGEAYKNSVATSVITARMKVLGHYLQELLAVPEWRGSPCFMQLCVVFVVVVVVVANISCNDCVCCRRLAVPIAPVPVPVPPRPR
jgi:hypothetical protein